MTIPSQSLRKLFRENFQGGEPLTPDKKDRKKLVEALEQRYKDDDWVDVSKHVSWQYRDKPERFLATLHLDDPERGYYYSRTDIELRINDEGVLEADSTGGTAPVASLEEIHSLVVECKRRLERRRVPPAVGIAGRVRLRDRIHASAGQSLDSAERDPTRRAPCLSEEIS